LQIGKRGLQEWLHYQDDWNSGHRSTSAVYPGREITRATPHLPGRGSLTGGCHQWQQRELRRTICLMARPGTGAGLRGVMEMLRATRPPVRPDSTRQPFQIDGNFGQRQHSRNVSEPQNEISLPPALPKAWLDGSVTDYKRAVAAR
jgi:hypothetical protein